MDQDLSPRHGEQSLIKQNQWLALSNQKLQEDKKLLEEQISVLQHELQYQKNMNEMLNEELLSYRMQGMDLSLESELGIGTSSSAVTKSELGMGTSSSAVTAPMELMRKTRLCDYWQTNQVCPRQTACNYAHGEEEIRCRHFIAGRCRFGDRCRHRHA